jgi:molybdopterin synthase catalytic subunit
MVAIVDHPIDVATVAASVRSRAYGAVLVFEGVGRDEHEGRPVLHLAYEAWEGPALAELERIAGECAGRWPGSRTAIVHRTGEVAIGEPSVVVATGAPHRDAAYAANRYAIDELKRRVPIWKKEVYADGSAWIGNKA